MREVKSTKVKRRIPFDQPIKIVILFLHFIGFSVWYGGAVIAGEGPAIFPAIAVVSGVFLVAANSIRMGLFGLE